MKQLEVLPGTSIESACAVAYDTALHGGHVFFDFNGVRVSMYGKLKRND